jgi:hypothetical protein
MRSQPLYAFLGRAALYGLAALLLVPVKAALAVVRFIAARPFVGDAMPCRTCGQMIPLLGLWQCSCGWRFYGRYWTRCEYCGDMPGFIDCLTCGASNFNPVVLG